MPLLLSADIFPQKKEKMENYSAGPDLSPNCLQTLSPNKKVTASKEKVTVNVLKISNTSCLPKRSTPTGMEE